MKLAQTENRIGTPITGQGPLGLEGMELTPISEFFDTVLSMIVGVLTIVASIYFLYLLILGGYSWMTAGGDKGQIEIAKKKLSSAVIGLTVVLASIFVLDLLGTILGMPYLTKPGEFIFDMSEIIKGS